MDIKVSSSFVLRRGLNPFTFQWINLNFPFWGNSGCDDGMDSSSLVLGGFIPGVMGELDLERDKFLFLLGLWKI